jgi:hypothetical protein
MDTTLNYLPSLVSVSSEYAKRTEAINDPNLTIILFSGIFLIGLVYSISLFLGTKKSN